MHHVLKKKKVKVTPILKFLLILLPKPTFYGA